MTGTYICDSTLPTCPMGPTLHNAHHTGHCYHDSTRRRLEWQYGENRINADDIARWNALGSGRRAAA